MSLKSRIEFEKAKMKSELNRLVMGLTVGNYELFSFDEVKDLIKSNVFVYRGIQSIPIKNIKGSEGRYLDFDRAFLPRHEGIREKWENMMDYLDSNPKIPPISVYKIGDYYIVRDGNHRVSVAKELGLEFIDAEVLEIVLDFPIKDLNEKELLIANAYKTFVEETKFDKVFPDVKIRLTNPWYYFVLIDHINTYRYFLGEKLGRAVSMDEAVKDWYEKLFSKVVKLIKERKLDRYFPERTPEDMYIWIMDHWHYLKENTKNPLLPIEKAIEDFENIKKMEDLSRLKKFLLNLIVFPIKLIYRFARFVLIRIF